MDYCAEISQFPSRSISKLRNLVNPYTITLNCWDIIKNRLRPIVASRASASSADLSTVREASTSRGIQDNSRAPTQSRARSNPRPRVSQDLRSSRDLFAIPNQHQVISFVVMASVAPSSQPDSQASLSTDVSNATPVTRLSRQLSHGLDLKK
jgi:hypothetical protein